MIPKIETDFKVGVVIIVATISGPMRISRPNSINLPSDFLNVR